MHKQQKTNVITPTDTAKPDTTDKNFDTFFTRFETDSVFQFSRIIFPVKTTTIEEDNIKTTRLIKRSDWKYQNILNDKSEKYIIRTLKVNQLSYKTTFQIEDTGVNIEYNFANMSGKWWLVGIDDSGD